jgi:hypothetical protein
MEQWFTRWPECNILFPDVGDAPLTSEESEKLAAVIVTRKKVRPYLKGGNLN